MSHIPPYTCGASAVILDPARHHEFAPLRDDLIRDTRPVNYAEQYLVDQILHAQWELRRNTRNLDRTRRKTQNELRKEDTKTTNRKEAA